MSAQDLIENMKELKRKLNKIKDQVKKVNYFNGIFCLNNADIIRTMTKRVDAVNIKICNKLQDFHLIENQK